MRDDVLKGTSYFLCAAGIALILWVGTCFAADAYKAPRLREAAWRGCDDPAFMGISPAWDRNDTRHYHYRCADGSERQSTFLPPGVDKEPE